jgi:hypothetical protein
LPDLETLIIISTILISLIGFWVIYKLNQNRIALAYSINSSIEIQANPNLPLEIKMDEELYGKNIEKHLQHLEGKLKGLDSKLDSKLDGLQSKLEDYSKSSQQEFNFALSQIRDNIDLTKKINEEIKKEEVLKNRLENLLVEFNQKLPPIDPLQDVFISAYRGSWGEPWFKAYDPNRLEPGKYGVEVQWFNDIKYSCDFEGVASPTTYASLVKQMMLRKAIIDILFKESHHQHDVGVKWRKK